MPTTDKFKKVGAGASTTLSAPGKALSATSLTVGSTANFPTTTGIIIAIRSVDTAGELVAGTYTEWSATVSSGTSLAIEAVPVYGSDQVYAAGATTQVFIPVSSYAQNTLIDGLLVAHNQDGTLKSGLTITSPALVTPALGTPASGVMTNCTGLTASGVVAGFPVQVVSTNYSAVATGTTVIPWDDTIPQITEGTEFMTQAITPKSATNKLSIEVTAMLATSVANDRIVCLFQDATAGALAGANSYHATGDAPTTVTLRHDMVAGTTSATTFRVRCGSRGAGTITFNGSTGTRAFGGITISNIKITEYKA